MEYITPLPGYSLRPAGVYYFKKRETIIMGYKLKSISGAGKRFRVRGNGKFKRASAFRRHLLTAKTTKTKRHLRGDSPQTVHASDQASIRQMLPNAK